MYFYIISCRYPDGNRISCRSIGNCPCHFSPVHTTHKKGEAYECGIPTRGRSWMQFKVGYYLFAILFLMFDVETVFLFPLGCSGTRPRSVRSV